MRVRGLGLGLVLLALLAVGCKKKGFGPSAIDRTVPTHLGDSTRFLWDGPGAVQTGVAPGAIRRELTSVLRGVVRGVDGAPLSGVKVTLFGGAEPARFGQTLTRSEGQFDFVVNGGSLVTLQLERAGYLTSHRQLTAPTLDFASPLDVVLVAEKPSTLLTLKGAPQWIEGTPETDASGSRKLSLFVPAATSATFVLPSGDVPAPDTVHLSITEYTVGDSGPRAMPADLPNASGYTYAVELALSEARAQGATQVNFDKTLYYYVDNFLAFPVGTIVPNGAYDRTRGVWVAEDSGHILAVLGVAAGLATIDADGDGVADDDTALSALGFSTDERMFLANHSAPGSILWRVPTTHFSPKDANWGRNAPSDAVTPLGPSDFGNEPKPDPCLHSGSIIECEGRVLSEGIALPGTPFGLVYRSDRVPGRRAAYELSIPLTPSTIPASMTRVDLEVLVAGQKHTQTFAPSPNLRTTFTWDGLDAYGRTVQGTQPVTVRIGYAYPATYGSTSTFGDPPSNVAVSTNDARTEVEFWIAARGVVGAWDARPAGFGGWTLSAHHGYDINSGVVQYGDGRQLRTGQVGKVIRTIAGLGLVDAVENGPAKTARIGVVRGVAFGPDGAIYFADESNHCVRRIDADGRLATFAGTGTAGFTGDGGLAKLAQLDSPSGVAYGADGTVYVSDRGNRRIRAIAPSGVIRTVAGNGATADGGDGGPATAAGLMPREIAIAPDGALYIADTEHQRVRRLGTNGIITTIAGDGTTGVLSFPTAVAVCPNGGIYFVDSQNNRIRAVLSGVMQTIAGTGFPDYTGDGGPAIDARLQSLYGIACGPDGTVYFSQGANIRAIAPNGIIDTVAGTGAAGDSGDDGPALSAQFFEPTALAVDGAGNLLIGDSFRHRIKRVGTPLPGLGLTDIVIASEEGMELFVFDSTGRHQKTLDGWTGAVRLRFEYDGNGRVIGVVDAAGNRTKIERNGGGDAKQVVSPFGVTTKLQIDSTTYLRKVVHASGDTLQMDYNPAGLLVKAIDPRGNTKSYVHDGEGRLLADTDAKLASQTLMAIDEQTVSYQTPLLHQTTIARVPTAKGELRTVTGPDGVTVSEALDYATGEQTTTYPEGTIVAQRLGPEPRFGMSTPIPAVQSVTLPSGKRLDLTMSRAVLLTNADDPLSVVTMEDTATRNGKVWKRVYDAASRTLTLTTPMGRTSSIALTAEGWPQRASVPKYADVSMMYDTKGRPQTLTQSTRVWSFGYDAASFFGSASGPMSTTATFVNDKIGRTTSIIAPGGVTYGYGWDASSNLTSTTMPSGAVYSFVPDAIDLPDKDIEPAIEGVTTTSSYGFDADRALNTVLQADGTTIPFVYDSFGRLHTIGVGSDAITINYDAVGRVESYTGSVQSLGVSYDGGAALGTTSSGVVSGSVTYSINGDFRIGTEAVNGGASLSFAYDDDGLLTGAGALVIGRDPQNGAISGTTLDATSDVMMYDAFGAPFTSTASHGATAQLTYGWMYDELGRVKLQTETVLGETHTDEYGYDSAGRLHTWKRDGVELASYDYDANGNRKSNAAAYDAQDRLLSDSSASYAHDLVGQRTSKTAGGATTTYRWDTLNRLVGVDLPSGQKVSYVYDPLGRIVARRVDGVLVDGFLYGDMLGPIAQLDGTGAVVSRFVYGARGESPEYIERGGTRYRVWRDLRGSPRLVVDATTGVVAQRIDYDVWGRITNDTNPGFQPFGYAGGLYDQRTGLTHFGVRDYDPETARWLSKDPLGRIAEPNAYRYVGNDPINFIDPTGLAGQSTFTRNFLDGYADARLGGALLLIDQEVVAQGVSPCIDSNSAGFKIGTFIGMVGGVRFRGASGGANAIRFDPARGDHVFRNAFGHVNPASAGSQTRFVSLFEKVASDPRNLRSDAVAAGIIDANAAAAGVEAYTWSAKSGQVWVTVRNGLIQNAGVNPRGSFR